MCIGGQSRATDHVSWPRFAYLGTSNPGGWAAPARTHSVLDPKSETATGSGDDGRPEISNNRSRAGVHNCAASYAVAGAGFGTDAGRN